MKDENYFKDEDGKEYVAVEDEKLGCTSCHLYLKNVCYAVPCLSIERSSGVGAIWVLKEEKDENN